MANALAYGVDVINAGGSSGGGGEGGGHVIVNPSGSSLLQRDGLQFKGYGVTVTDDINNNRTVVSAGAHAIVQPDGNMIAQQPALQFIGSGVQVTNNTSGSYGKTVVQIDGGGHTIVDSSGNAYPQRSKLCFTGDLVRISDSSIADTITININKNSGNEDVTADGVKTISELLDDLYAEIDMSKMSGYNIALAKEHIVVDYSGHISGEDVTESMETSIYFLKKGSASITLSSPSGEPSDIPFIFYFFNTETKEENGEIIIETNEIILKESGSTFYTIRQTENGITKIDHSSEVPAYSEIKPSADPPVWIMDITQFAFTY